MSRHARALHRRHRRDQLRLHPRVGATRPRRDGVQPRPPQRRAAARRAGSSRATSRTTPPTDGWPAATSTSSASSASSRRRRSGGTSRSSRATAASTSSSARRRPTGSRCAGCRSPRRRRSTIPHWAYSRAKAEMEALLRAQARLPYTIVRPSHTYRTRMPTPMADNIEVSRLLRGKPVVVHGDGESLWTVTHAEDFARPFARLLGARGALGEAFHITGDRSWSWNEIFEAIAAALGVPRYSLVHVASDTLVRYHPEWEGPLLGDKSAVGGVRQPQGEGGGRRLRLPDRPVAGDAHGRRAAIRRPRATSIRRWTSCSTASCRSSDAGTLRRVERCRRPPGRRSTTSRSRSGSSRAAAGGRSGDVGARHGTIVGNGGTEASL